MKRVSIFIREDQFENLNKLSKVKNITVAELIREAIDYKLLVDFENNAVEHILEKTYGMLKERFKDEISSEKIVSEMRKDWENRIEAYK